jgi:hypothetical protein
LSDRAEEAAGLIFPLPVRAGRMVVVASPKPPLGIGDNIAAAYFVRAPIRLKEV